jgi:hypothetical protein
MSQPSAERTNMTKRIIFKTPEGGVAVIIPATTIEACMKDIPEGAEFAIVDTADIPEDRTFRGAWSWVS